VGFHLVVRGHIYYFLRALLLGGKGMLVEQLGREAIMIDRISRLVTESRLSRSE